MFFLGGISEVHMIGLFNEVGNSSTFTTSSPNSKKNSVFRMNADLSNALFWTSLGITANNGHWAL